MTDSMSSLLLLGAEFGLILILIFIGLLIYFFRRRSADKRYVSEFIAEHKNKQAERREAMRESMKEDSLLIDEDLESHLDKMSSSEKKLYKRILNMYLGFDRKCMPEIREELLVINDSWMDAMRLGIANAADTQLEVARQLSSEEVEELNAKIESLSADKEKMAGELAEAMETMEDIVKEYSLMYAGQENPTMDRLSADYDNLKKKSDAHSNEDES